MRGIDMPFDKIKFYVVTDLFVVGNDVDDVKLLVDKYRLC